MTEEIKHINQKNQEYIAEGNRMTKETKIGKKDVVACNYWKACDYYKQLKRLEFELKVTKADYEASEQENRELKAYKDVNEDFKKAWDELNEKYKLLRSTLEEIRNYCDRIEQGSVIGTQDCLINSIKNITNEVLQ